MYADLSIETTFLPSLHSHTHAHTTHTLYRSLKLTGSLKKKTDAACSFPIFVRRLPSIPIPHRFLFLSRHFGTGVLIATAFVHLLPTAFVSMTDPCLPAFWNKGYPAMAGLVAMMSTLAIVGVEMFFASHGAGHMHGHDGTSSHQPLDVIKRPAGSKAHEAENLVVDEAPIHFTPDGSSRRDHDSAGKIYHHERGSRDRTTNDHPWTSDATLPDNDDPAEQEDLSFETDELGHDSGVVSLISKGKRREIMNDIDHQHHEPRHQAPPRNRGSVTVDETGLSEQQQQQQQQQEKKLLLQCLLLEAGILFHSIFIGLALSVATGTSFVVLLIAISFHRKHQPLIVSRTLGYIRIPLPFFGTTIISRFHVFFRNL